MWWVLIILVVVIVAVVVAVNYQPVPPPPPAATRMKVPPMPPSEPPSPESMVEDPAGTEEETPAPLPQGEQEESDAMVTAPNPTTQTTESRQEPEAMTANAEPSTITPETEPEQTDSADGPETAATNSPDIVTETEVTKGELPEARTSEEKPMHHTYTLQLGVFRNKTYAEIQVEEMKQIGYDAFLSPVVGTNDETLYLVCTGEFSKKSDALAAALEFSKKENMKAVVATYR